MQLFHEIAGEGPPVLLVHAGICDSRMWEPQWRTFPRTHRTIRCDLRGFGRTPIPAETYSNAADLAALLEAVADGPVAVVGASMGGLMALDLTLARPELVASLVLVGAPVPGHAWSGEMKRFDDAEETALGRGDVDEAVELNLRMWIDGPHRGPDEVDAELRRSVGEMQRRAFELQLAAGDEASGEMLVSDPGERLGEISVPALILVGELDCDDIQATAALLAAGIPGARSASIAATAHVPSMERPAEFDRLVLGFLAG